MPHLTILRSHKQNVEHESCSLVQKANALALYTKYLKIVFNLHQTMWVAEDPEGCLTLNTSKAI